MLQERIRSPGEGCSGLALYGMVQGGTEIVQSAEGEFFRMLSTPNIISHPHIQLNCLNKRYTCCSLNDKQIM